MTAAPDGGSRAGGSRADDLVAADGLAGLLSPRRVAVVGASESPGNRGGQAIAYLRKFGFAGTVTPVHPSGRSVHGYPGVASLAHLGHVPDVALVAVGARNVTPVISDLGRHGVRAAIVWAGGFAEGGPEGARLQRELSDTARRAGVRVLGPNCLGLINTTASFCGTFASWLKSADEVLPGHISMVTQSGGLGAAAHAAAQAFGVGFRFMASTGNEADISAVEMLELFAGDPQTRVICSYLEGCTEGRRLVAALARARANGKDVVVLKGGRSSASARAVAAHTGALAGQARVWAAMLAAADAVQVYSLEELVEVSVALAAASGKPACPGRRVGIVSYGGGSGVLAADQCAEAGLEVPQLSDAAQSALRAFAPDIASLRNPIDLTPEAFNQDRYRAHFPDLLRVLMDSPEIDAVLLQGGAMSRGADEAARAMCEFHRTGTKQISVYWPAVPDQARQIFRDHGIRVHELQQVAVATLSRVIRARQAAGPVAVPGEPPASIPAARPVPFPPPWPGDLAPGQVLSEPEVHRLLRAAGLPTLRAGLARTADEAAGLAADIGGPVAMKVVSPQVTHRAEAGLIRLPVTGGAAVRAAYAELAAAAAGRTDELTGVYVQEMGPRGTEFIVSAFRDEAFGPVVSVGSGGVLTELLDDVTFGLAPAGPAAARAMIGRLRLAGYLERRHQAACLDALAEFLAGFSALGAALPWRGYVLELNPVIAAPGHAVAADGLAIGEAQPGREEG